MKRTRDPKKLKSYQEELALPPYPFEIEHVWDAYWRLRNRVNGSGHGIGRITWADIDAFSRHSRISMLPREIELVEAIDDLFLAEAAKPRTP